MVIGTPDNSYEDEMHHALDIPMVADLSQKKPETADDLVKSSNYDPKTDVYQAPLEEPKDVHIVRHGETQANDTNTVRGQDPIPLNENGRAEAEKAADNLKAKGVDTIVASDLKRSRETAEIIGKKLGITPTYDRRLRTWDVGDHTGQPCSTSNPILKEYAQNKQDEPVPGGESFNDFQDRSFAGIRDAILNNKDKNLAIVTHNRVEATLKGWEKTGQNNPNIDYNEVIKEETEPGTVRTVQFQPNATLLQPTNTFNERFPKEPGQSFPSPLDVPHGKDQVKNWFKYLPKQTKDEIEQAREEHRSRLQGILGKDYNTVESDYETKEDPFATYKPMSDKNYVPFSPSQEKSIEDLAAKHGLEGSKVLNFLKELKPEDIIGTGELGGVAKTLYSRKIIQDLLDKGLSYAEIAKQLGTNRNVIGNAIARMRKANEPAWFKEEMNDPETKALSEWYRNQFEGGPIEPEKPGSIRVEDIGTQGVTDWKKKIDSAANQNVKLKNKTEQNLDLLKHLLKNE